MKTPFNSYQGSSADPSETGWCHIHGHLSSYDLRARSLDRKLTCKVCLDNKRDKASQINRVLESVQDLEIWHEEHPYLESDPVRADPNGLYHATDFLRLAKSQDAFEEPLSEGYSRLIEALRHQPPNEPNEREVALSRYRELVKAHNTAQKALNAAKKLTYRDENSEKDLAKHISRIERQMNIIGDQLIQLTEAENLLSIPVTESPSRNSPD